MEGIKLLKSCHPITQILSEVSDGFNHGGKIIPTWFNLGEIIIEFLQGSIFVNQLV